MPSKFLFGYSMSLRDATSNHCTMRSPLALGLPKKNLTHRVGSVLYTFFSLQSLDELVTRVAPLRVPPQMVSFEF